MRRFESVKDEFKKFPNIKTELPIRATMNSAGYDFFSKEDYILHPGEYHIFWTDVKAIMYFDNFLQIHTRSGNGCKRGIVLRNCTAIIDADYANNPENDGNIGICLKNSGENVVEIKVGDKIADGIFIRYMIVDDDEYMNSKEPSNRTGRFGSTGR